MSQVSHKEEPVLEGELEPKDGQMELEGFNVIRIADVEHSERQLITKSNRLICAFSRLSLNEQRLLGAAISKVNPLTELKEKTLIRVDLHASEIVQLTGIDISTVKRFAQQAAIAFHSTPVDTPGKKPGTVDVINIAHRSQYDPDTGVMSLTFHELILPEIVALKSHFASYRLNTFVALSSKYHTRFFELMTSARVGRLVYKLYDPEDLAHSLYFVLGLKGPNESLGRGKGKKGNSLIRHFGMFRDRILLPAIEELNAKTDLKITFEDIKKRGRSTYAVVLRKEITGEGGLARSLNELGFDDVATRDIIKQHGVELTGSCIELLTRLHAEGHSFDSPTAFLRYLLKYQIPALPDRANPYSGLYAGRPRERRFLSKIVVPLWNQLPSEPRNSIEQDGPLSVYIVDDYVAYVDAAKQGPDAEEHFLLVVASDIRKRFSL